VSISAPTRRRPETARVDAPRPGRVAGVLVRERWLLLVLAAGAAMRVLAGLAIWPGIWFSDSNSYIESAATGRLSLTRVDGYALVVSPFWHLGSAGALVAVQHVLGLGIVALLYVLLVRRGVSRGVAALAVVPAALDAYLVVVEHAVMSETIYHALLVGAIALLLWGERPGWPAAAVAGLLLGYAGITRSVAVPLAVLFLAYVLVRRAGWRTVVALCVGWAVVAGGYVVAFHHQHGVYGFTRSSGDFLYAKVAPFADCSDLHGIPPSERALCPDPAVPLTTNAYLWGGKSPIHGLPPSDAPRIRDFALRVIRQRPLHYAGVVGGGVLHFFEPGHRIGANDYPVSAWQFPADPRRWGYPGYRGPIRAGNPTRRRHHAITEPNVYVARMAGTPQLDAGVSRFLHGYQRIAYTWGPLLAACVLLAVVALAARRGAWRLRLDAAFLAGLVLAALVVSQALSVFSYRYGLIAALLLPVSAALAWTALRAPRVVE
jgi:hypothetical protein